MSGGLARDVGYYRAVKYVPVLNQVNRIMKEKAEIAWWVCVVSLSFLVLPVICSIFHFSLLCLPGAKLCLLGV